MRRRRRLAALLTLAVTCCGYSTARLEGLPGVTTIAVLPVENTTFRRDLGLQLARAVAEEIRARTAYALTTPDRADVLLQTRLDAREQVVLQRQDREVVQRRFQGDLEVHVTDRRTGRTRARYTVQASIDFSPQRADAGVDAAAAGPWARRMAVRVVSGLEPGF